MAPTETALGPHLVRAAHFIRNSRAASTLRGYRDPDGISGRRTQFLQVSV